MDDASSNLHQEAPYWIERHPIYNSREQRPYYWHRITGFTTLTSPVPMSQIRWVGWVTSDGRWYYHDVVNNETLWSLPILARADSSDDTDGDASDVSQGQEATDSRADYRSQVSGLRSQVAEVDFMHGQVASDVSPVAASDSSQDAEVVDFTQGQVASDVSQVAASDSSQDAGVVDWSFSRAAVDFYTMD
jgi:hypothetical protein